MSNAHEQRVKTADSPGSCPQAVDNPLALRAEGSTCVFVPGTPTPQGSAKAYIVKGRARVTGDNPKTMPWRADVAAHVRSEIGPTIAIPEGPVVLTLSFVMPRRKAEPKRITPPHTRKPDLDKLSRAVMDALSGLVYTDDAQVIALDADKATALIGEQPGVHIAWRLG